MPKKRRGVEVEKNGNFSLPISIKQEWHLQNTKNNQTQANIENVKLLIV